MGMILIVLPLAAALVAYDSTDGWSWDIFFLWIFRGITSLIGGYVLISIARALF